MLNWITCRTGNSFESWRILEVFTIFLASIISDYGSISIAVHDEIGIAMLLGLSLRITITAVWFFLGLILDCTSKS